MRHHAFLFAAVCLAVGCEDTQETDTNVDTTAETPELVSGEYTISNGQSGADACDDNDAPETDGQRINFTATADGWSVVYGPFPWEATCTETSDLVLDCVMSRSTGSWSSSTAAASCTFSLDIAATIDVTGYAEVTVDQTNTHTTTCQGAPEDIPYATGSCDLSFTYDAAQ